MVRRSARKKSRSVHSTDDRGEVAEVEEVEEVEEPATTATEGASSDLSLTAEMEAQKLRTERAREQLNNLEVQEELQRLQREEELLKRELQRRRAAVNGVLSPALTENPGACAHATRRVLQRLPCPIYGK